MKKGDIKMNQNKIGKIIENKRKEKKLTQKELADTLGVSNTAISKWENGNNLPDISLLEPLCTVLELDLLELISIQNSAHEDSSKKFNKIRKAKLYRTLALSIIFLSIICITNICTYNKVMDKRKSDLSKAVEVYNITSKNDNFTIDGYAIFNEKDNFIFLENIIFQGIDNYKIDYKKIKYAEFFIMLDKQVIILQKIKPETEKITNLKDILDFIKTTSYPTEVSLKKNKGKFHKLEFKLDLYDKDKNKSTISVDLQLTRTFT